MLVTITKLILSNNINAGGVTIRGFKLYYRNNRNKNIVLTQKQKSQTTGEKRCNYSHLIFEKALNIIGNKTAFLTVIKKVNSHM